MNFRGSIFGCVLFLATLSHAAESLDQRLEWNWKLFKFVLSESDSHQSVVFSPWAFQKAFEMAALGARGTTQRQLLGGVRSGPGDKKNSSFSLARFHMANRLWIQRDYPLLESYMKLSEAKFNLRPWMVDFTKEPEFLIHRINDWVSERTYGKVQDFLPIDFASTEIKMLLTSAFYLKADWLKPFTLKQKMVEGQVHSFLEVQSRFNFYQGKDFQLLELPYVDPDLMMILILPSEAGREKDEWASLRQLEESLPSSVLHWQTTHQGDLKVRLPQVSFQSLLDLSEAAKRVGIQAAFSQTEADFSGMTQVPGLYLRQMRQKTLFSLTESGAEVSVGLESEGRSLASEKMEFDADRPFLFAVVQPSSRDCLLMGRVVP